MEKAITDRERFEQLTGNADAFLTIDQLVAICDEGAYWTDEFMQTSTRNAKKAHIRRLIKTIKDDDDWPVWASIDSTDEDGNMLRVYKQELLFDVEDYRKVVTYHADRSAYHKQMALGYGTHCKRRFGIQLHFDFDDDTE